METITTKPVQEQHEHLDTCSHDKDFAHLLMTIATAIFVTSGQQGASLKTAMDETYESFKLALKHAGYENPIREDAFKKVFQQVGEDRLAVALKKMKELGIEIPKAPADA